MEECKTIVILGYGRSGTSLVAGILNSLGINMGERLYEKDSFNPLGYFEDVDFMWLNNEILERVLQKNSIYDGFNNLPPKREEILKQNKKFSKKIRKLIKKKNKSKVWGWKHPLTALTIDLFLPYLRNPYFIVCKRRKTDIIKSVLKIKKNNINHISKVIDAYNERINNFFTRHKHLKKLEVKYENLIKTPQKEIRKIIDFLEISPTKEEFEKAVRMVLPKKRIKRFSNKLKNDKKIKLKRLIYYFRWCVNYPNKFLRIPRVLYRRIFNISNT